MSLPEPAPNRTALVTGGSSGIGRAIARELARRGHAVALVARREDELDHVATALEREGARVEVLVTDLADRDARAALPGRVAARGLVVDVLVNNAGLRTRGPIATSDPDVEVAMVEVDVTAVADLCSRFLPGMVARHRGAILNVASVVAFERRPGEATYAASKAFVLSYTRSLAEELRGTGVTATALCPGPVPTQIGRVDRSERGSDTRAAVRGARSLSAETVARAGLQALDDGRAVVIPGSANKVVVGIARLAPGQAQRAAVLLGTARRRIIKGPGAA